MSENGYLQTVICNKMIFNSFNFIVLFPFIFLLYYIIPAKYVQGRNMFLLITSYLLYIQWEAIYAFILLGVTAITFFSARLIEKTAHRKITLSVGVFLTLFPLLFFKYFNFISDNISSMLLTAGLQFRMEGLNWAIPVGISFFTFQALGYLWDVYYKQQQAEQNFLNYALFVSFFPSLLSGPINKASLIIPQIKNLRPYFDYHKAVGGLKLLLWGMFMKVVVADRISLFVNNVYDNYQNYTGLTCFISSILYTIQIYADFAGYSFMAIGVGKILGFELTKNFQRPYFAVSVTDFWHRWHISLSTWLKDYVYIPLGGSRCSKLRNYWNIFCTFLVSGIWHGANWTFIVWGCMHGVCQVIEKMVNQNKCNYGWLGKIIKIIITFFVVNFAWVFFRMPTLHDAIAIIMRMFDFSLPMTQSFTDDLISFPFILFGVFVLFIKDLRDEFFPHRFLLMNNKHTWIRWVTYIIVMLIILLCGVLDSSQFIYANF